MKKFAYILFIFLNFTNIVFASASKTDNQISGEQIEDKKTLNELNKTAQEIGAKKAKINTTIDLSGFLSDILSDDIDTPSKNFLDKLKTCQESNDKVNILNAEYKIIGFTDNKEKCQIDILLDNKQHSCFFPSDKLSSISDYYKNLITQGFSGKYNIDLDMKMPEIDFKNISEDNLDFGIKLEMPKIKFDKIQSDIEKIINEACNINE